MNGVPFFAPAGTVLNHVGMGRLRFLEHLGNWVLHIVPDADPDAGPVMVRVQGSDELVMPTVPWVLAEHAEGRLWDVGGSTDAGSRSAKFLGFDRAACMARDPKSAYRHDWALAAIKAEMPRSAEVLKDWIATAPIPRHPDDTDYVRQLKDKRPGARAVIEWMNKLRGADMRMGALVNASGRQVGETQLSNVLDRLVHRVAMTFIADGRLATIDDAAALCVRWWKELKAANVPDIGLEPPSGETIRLRVRLLDGRTSEEIRDGKHGAKKRFRSSGEPVEVERPFERVFMDGTEFEHACLYSEDWPIPAAKMKGVYAMCAYTQYVSRGAVFTGPYRAEMGIKAALNIMVPPLMTAEEVAADPHEAVIAGLPSDLMYDNDKANLPPNLVPAAVTATSSVELAPAYLHDAKAKLENYFKFVKRKIRKVKGQVRGPSRMSDPRYDPIKSAEVNLAQYAQMVEDARREWNDKPRKAFGNKSPRQLMIEFLNAGGNRLVDYGEIRRHFAGTPSELQILTNDGLVYDNVRYRWNRDGTDEILDNNHRRTPFSKRLVGTAKVFVPIRVYDGDIDMIEVLDEETGKYHRMWSTNPRYTGGLSRWEHQQYCEMIRAGKGGAISERDRLAFKANKIVAFDQDLPKASFSARENMVALMQKEDIRRKSGARGSDPLFGQLPEIGLVTELGGQDRADRPEPPPQPQERKPKSEPKAPKRTSDYGYASVTRDGDEASQVGGQVQEEEVDDPKPKGRWDDDRED